MHYDEFRTSSDGRIITYTITDAFNDIKELQREIEKLKEMLNENKQ